MVRTWRREEDLNRLDCPEIFIFSPPRRLNVHITCDVVQALLYGAAGGHEAKARRQLQQLPRRHGVAGGPEAKGRHRLERRSTTQLLAATVRYTVVGLTKKRPGLCARTQRKRAPTGRRRDTRPSTGMMLRSVRGTASVLRMSMTSRPSCVSKSVLPVRQQATGRVVQLSRRYRRHTRLLAA